MKNKASLLEDTFKQLNRKFETINIKQLNDLPPIKDNVVSTGIMGLDIAIGVGGIKKGSIVEIYAPESAGKTTLALQLCKQYQKLDKPVLYIDTERTLNRETIESIGIKLDVWAGDIYGRRCAGSGSRERRYYKTFCMVFI